MERENASFWDRFAQRDLPRFLVFVSGYYFGGTVAVALHEVGHLLGALIENTFSLGKITISGLILNPFADSRVIAHGEAGVVFAIGGLVFGPLLAWACVLPGWLWMKPGKISWLLAYFIGIMGMG